MFYLQVATRPRPDATTEELETIDLGDSLSWVMQWITILLPIAWLDHYRENQVIRVLEQAGFTNKHQPPAGASPLPIKAMVRTPMFKAIPWVYTDQTAWTVVLHLDSEGIYTPDPADRWHFRH
jgi:hypothetical protein